MQDRLIEEVQKLNEEKPKKKPSDFIEEDTHEAKLQILVGLQDKPVYRGTVDKETIRRRRAKNKRARAARRKSR